MVKIRGYYNVDVVWMMEEDIKKKSTTLQELISSGLEINLLEVYGAGAPR